MVHRPARRADYRDWQRGAFNAVSLLLLNGVVPRGGLVTEESLPTVIQSMGLADVSFLVVGLLAAKLAERQLTSDVHWQRRHAP